MKYKLLLLLFSFTAFSQTKAQQQVKGFELIEIVKLAEAYKNVPNLSFNLNYTYADSAQPLTIIEQMTGSTKLSSGKYWTMLDSVELIQGGKYRLAIYHQDSTIVAGDKMEYDDMFKLPFLDSAFRQSNVDSMSVTQLTDSVWQLLVLFNTTSSFSKYKLDYNRYNYRTKKIEYFIRNVPQDSTGVLSGTALITLTVSGYSTAPVDPNIFNEDKYIYKSNGMLMTRPPYQNFTLVNNTSN